MFWLVYCLASLLGGSFIWTIVLKDSDGALDEIEKRINEATQSENLFELLLGLVLSLPSAILFYLPHFCMNYGWLDCAKLMLLVGLGGLIISGSITASIIFSYEKTLTRKKLTSKTIAKSKTQTIYCLGLALYISFIFCNKKIWRRPIFPAKNFASIFGT